MAEMDCHIKASMLDNHGGPACSRCISSVFREGMPVPNIKTASALDARKAWAALLADSLEVV